MSVAICIFVRLDGYVREISLTSIVCRDCGDPSKARSYQLFLWVELSTMVIGKVIMVSAKCQMVFDKTL